MLKKERFRAYIAVYLVLIKDGQILLLRRYNTNYENGKYSLVSGHIEGSETAKQAIIRESKEEAGITLKPKDLEVVQVMHRINPHREYFDIYLRAKKWTGKITNMEPDKCDELKWYRLDNLPKNTLPEVKLALKNINAGVHYSEYGWKK